MSLDFEAEFIKARTWLKRLGKEAQLVTEGHILEPPFKASYVADNGMMQVTIEGSNDKFTVSCNRIITSRFRTGQIGFFVFNAEDVVVGQRAVALLRKSHQLILEAFPPGSVFTSDTLYDKIRTQGGEIQKHARRRWKELKYYYGFDVDYGGEDDSRSKYWRGPSTVPINDPNLRPNDKNLRAAFLPELHKRSLEVNQDTLPHCNRCNARVYFKDFSAVDEEFDDAGLLDHRRPVFQGGEDTEGNLQIFCQTCNNLKNTVCRNCPYGFKCDTCIWAFPELVRSRRLVLILDQELIDRLRSKFGQNIESPVLDILRQVTSDNT